MGQYYKVYMQEGNNEKFLSGDVLMAPAQGKKLLEQSWWDNALCEAVSAAIYRTKTAVAWIGDYAIDPAILNDEKFCDCRNDIQRVYNIMWKERRKGKDIHSVTFRIDGKYLVNHKNKIFVDFNKYKVMSEGKNRILHPLPLLTAVGNGMGGGDYHGEEESNVGTWAFCPVSIEDTIPEGYKEKTYSF